MMLRAAEAVCPELLLSATVTPKENVPLAVGLPEITPLAAASVKPGGRLPDVIDQR
jgi:hypothetical protein